MTRNSVEPATHSLPRILGLFDATCIVIGAIIGVGIFFSPGQVARVAGSGELALAAWCVGGLIALCGALTFAALGVRYPNAGGQYEILRDCYGPLPGFLFVFCNATAVQAGAIAIIAIICAQNAAVAIAGREFSDIAAILLAAGLILIVTAANVMGVLWGSGIQNVTVVAKLATIATIVVIAIAFAPGLADPATAAPSGATSRPPTPLLIALFAAMVPTFFAYGGWQHALWIAGEVRRPERNLPLAIIGGVALVVIAYVAVNWAYLRLLGYSGATTSGTLAADAVGRVWSDGGRRAIAGAVALSAFGVLNAQLLSGPRLIYRLAQDGRFFAWFGYVNRRTSSPIRAVGLLGALGLILLIATAALSSNAIAAIDRLTVGVVFIDGVFFVLTAVSLFLIRARDARAGVALSGPNLGFPVAPAIFVVGEVGLLIGAYAEPATRSAAVIGFGWIAAATLIYLLLFRGPIANCAPAGK